MGLHGFVQLAVMCMVGLHKCNRKTNFVVAFHQWQGGINRFYSFLIRLKHNGSLLPEIFKSSKLKCCLYFAYCTKIKIKTEVSESSHKPVPCTVYIASD